MRSKKALWLAIGVMFLGAMPCGAQDLLWQTLMESADKSLHARNYQAAESQLTAALKSLDGQVDKGHARMAATLRKLATTYDIEGECAKAAAVLEKLIALDEKNNAQLDLAHDLNSLAVVHRHEEKCTEAEREFKRALSILEKRKDSPIEALAGVQLNLSMLYQDMGKYEEEESLLKRALTNLQSAGDNPKESLTAVLDQLSKLYSLQNRFSEAEPLLKKSLELKEKSLGIGHVEIANELTQLGKLYQAQGNFDEAEKQLKRALALAEREHGAKHPEVASTLLNMGDLYRQQNKLSDAIPLYERSIAIRELSLGKQHVQVAQAISKLAEAYLDSDKYDRAETLYKQALSIDELATGTESREVAKDLSNLALVYVNQGRYHEAESLYKRSLANVERQVGQNHPDTATCLNNLAYLHVNEGKLAEAEVLIKKALAIRESTLGKDHPAVARNMALQAEILISRRQWAGAEALLSRAIDIEKLSLDPSHPDIASNMRDLCAVLEAQKKWSDAEALYKQLIAVDGSTQANESTLASDMDGLVKTLLAQGKEEEAKPLKGRAVYIKEKLPGALISVGGMTKEPLAMKPLAGAERPIRDKWALVIGISNFQDPSMNLKFASKDATDFRNYLVQDAHFQQDHVKLLTDKEATRENIVSHLGEKWLKRLANPDDLVVIYISSHGSSAKQEANRANFIVPHDGNLENIVFNGIPMQWLTAGIKGLIHSDRIVLVLDVCHGGAVADGAKGIRRGDDFDFAKIAPGEGQIVVASSQADQISWESKKYSNGVFTRRLLEGLKRNGDQTKLKDAFEYMKDKVQEEVLRDRAYLQTPVLVTQWWNGDDISIGTPPSKPRSGLAVVQPAVTPALEKQIVGKDKIKAIVKPQMRTKQP